MNHKAMLYLNHLQNGLTVMKGIKHGFQLLKRFRHKKSNPQRLIKKALKKRSRYKKFSLVKRSVKSILLEARFMRRILSVMKLRYF